jgi:hypothetical protein
MMSDKIDPVRTEPSRSRSRRRLGCVGVVLSSVVLALVLGVSAALLIPVPSCACATPLDLAVQNYSHQDASVNWSQPGILGSPLRGLSGGAAVAGCRTLIAGLRSGVVEVSVISGEASRTFQLHIRDAVSDAPAVIVIGADGRIADPLSGFPPGGYPYPDPLC